MWRAWRSKWVKKATINSATEGSIRYRFGGNQSPSGVTTESKSSAPLPVIHDFTIPATTRSFRQYQVAISIFFAPCTHEKRVVPFFWITCKNLVSFVVVPVFSGQGRTRCRKWLCCVLITLPTHAAKSGSTCYVSMCQPKTCPRSTEISRMCFRLDSRRSAAQLTVASTARDHPHQETNSIWVSYDIAQTISYIWYCPNHLDVCYNPALIFTLMFFQVSPFFKLEHLYFVVVWFSFYSLCFGCTISDSL